VKGSVAAGHGPWLPRGPHLPGVRADQQPTSRLSELMVRHELQVGTAGWPAADDETMPSARSAGAAVRQLGCRTTQPLTCW